MTEADAAWARNERAHNLDKIRLQQRITTLEKENGQLAVDIANITAERDQLRAPTFNFGKAFEQTIGLMGWIVFLDHRVTKLLIKTAPSQDRVRRKDQWQLMVMFAAIMLVAAVTATLRFYLCVIFLPQIFLAIKGSCTTKLRV